MAVVRRGYDALLGRLGGIHRTAGESWISGDFGLQRLGSDDGSVLPICPVVRWLEMRTRPALGSPRLRHRVPEGGRPAPVI